MSNLSRRLHQFCGLLRKHKVLQEDFFFFIINNIKPISSIKTLANYVQVEYPPVDLYLIFEKSI